jgi:hypothetical protein
MKPSADKKAQREQPANSGRKPDPRTILTLTFQKTTRLRKTIRFLSVSIYRERARYVAPPPGVGIESEPETPVENKDFPPYCNSCGYRYHGFCYCLPGG